MGCVVWQAMAHRLERERERQESPPTSLSPFLVRQRFPSLSFSLSLFINSVHSLSCLSFIIYSPFLSTPFSLLSIQLGRKEGRKEERKERKKNKLDNELLLLFSFSIRTYQYQCRGPLLLFGCPLPDPKPPSEGLFLTFRIVTDR